VSGWVKEISLTPLALGERVRVRALAQKAKTNPGDARDEFVRTNLSLAINK